MTDSPQFPPPQPHQKQAPLPYAGGQSRVGQPGQPTSGGQPSAPQYAGGAPYAGPGLPPAPRRGGSRALANFLGVLLSIVLTPIGIGLLGHFSYQRFREMQIFLEPNQNLIALLCVIAGVVLLFLVAASAGWAPAGPVVAGLLFGVLPGLVYLVAPTWSMRTTFDLPGDVGLWLGTYGALSMLLLLGWLLVGAGLAGALARRAGRRSG